MKDWAFSALAMGVLLACFLVPVAAARAADGDLEQHLPGWKLARFLPLQGRMVLEHEGEMLVVRSGEEIPGLPGVSVKTIGSGGALIEIEDSPDGLKGLQSQTKYWLLVKSASDGTTKVIEIRQEPEEGLLPELSVETQEIPVSGTPSGADLKEMPKAVEGNTQ